MDQTLYGWVGSADGPGLFETRQAIIDKADHADIVKLSDKYVRHDDLPGTAASVLTVQLITVRLPHQHTGIAFQY